MIKINDECMACNICISVCKHKAIYLEDNRYHINPTICIECEECIPECPNESIKIILENND